MKEQFLHLVTEHPFMFFFVWVGSLGALGYVLTWLYYKIIKGE